MGEKIANIWCGKQAPVTPQGPEAPFGRKSPPLKIELLLGTRSLTRLVASPAIPSQLVSEWWRIRACS